MFKLNLVSTPSVASSGLSTAKVAEVRASITAAAEAWGRYIDAPNAVIDVELTIDDIPGVALATAGAQYFSTTGPFQSSVTQELAGNTDVDPGSKDGTLRIDLQRLQDPDFYFFDTSFEANPEGLVNTKIDFMSVMVHEFAHILGLSVATNFLTPFGAMTQVIGGVNYFVGANAVAANGGNNVELTGSHLVSEDLLDPTTTSGERGIITPVHIGMWQDIGVPIVQTTSAADVVFGFEAFNDDISSGAGNDIIHLLSGADTVDGGDDFDTVIYSADRDAFVFDVREDGSITVEADDGSVDTLTSIEKIEVSDGSLLFGIPDALPINFADGNVLSNYAYPLYSAALDRTPDGPGLEFWSDFANSDAVQNIAFDASLGQSAEINGQVRLAAEFVISPEFNTADTATNDGFVTKLYSNFLGRDPDAPGFEFWSDVFERRLNDEIPNGRLPEDVTIFDSSTSQFVDVTTEQWAKAWMLRDFASHPDIFDRIQDDVTNGLFVMDADLM